MSGEFSRLLGLAQEDPKQLELVKKIIEKTKEGKIGWEKTASAFVAVVPGMQLTLVRNPGVFVQGTWERFTIKTPNGAEILKIENPLTSFFPGVGSQPRSPLVEHIDQLFSTVDRFGKGDLDKAIDVINNL